MKKEYNYFYKITNKINNRYYYGVHKTNNMNDGYMGSGKRLKYAYIKYGVQNFEKEIIKFFDTYEEALEYESEIVTEKLVNDIECYNLKIGGKGGNGWIFENKKGNFTVIDKETNKFVKISKNSDYYKNKDNYYFFTENKISMKDINGNNILVDKNDNRYLNGELSGVTKGMVTVKDKDNNYFLIDKSDNRYLNGELKCIWKNRKHNIETIEKMKFTHQLRGNNKKEKNSQFGTCWIHNLELKENKKIKKEELNNWTGLGWIKGRKMNF